MSMAAMRGRDGVAAAVLAGGAAAAGFAPVATVAVTMQSRRVKGTRNDYRLECIQRALVPKELLSRLSHDCHDSVTDRGHHLSRRRESGVQG